MMGYYTGYYWWYGGLWMELCMLVIIVAFIWLLIWLSHNHQHMPHNQEDKAPLFIIKERYAKGEISKKEFDSIKKDLEG